MYQSNPDTLSEKKKERIYFGDFQDNSNKSHLVPSISLWDVQGPPQEIPEKLSVIAINC